ncbi:hypothetical protein ACFVHQ_06345 [Actinomycetes bacterium NPDC127524]
MKKLISVIFTVGLCLLLSSPGLARENVITTKIHSLPEAPLNYVFKNPDAKAKASNGDFFKELSGKMQAIFKKYDEGEIDEAEVAKLIKIEISALLPNKEFEIALQLSERKARQGK